LAGTGAGVLAGVVSATALVVGTSLCATVVGCTFGGALIITATSGVGGGVGYLVGSSESAYWDSAIILHDYSKFHELPCTYLEGKASGLEVKN